MKKFERHIGPPDERSIQVTSIAASLLRPEPISSDDVVQSFEEAHRLYRVFHGLNEMTEALDGLEDFRPRTREWLREAGRRLMLAEARSAADLMLKEVIAVQHDSPAVWLALIADDEARLSRSGRADA